MSARRLQGQSYADVAAKPPPESSSDVTPAVPSYVQVLKSNPESSNLTDLICRDVIYKLLGFTAAMFALPIGMYFASVNAIFGGEVAFPWLISAMLIL